ncbi:type IV pilus biogenesis protein PilM [Alkalicoccus daliensis]|uniref:Type IV pilus assembly protein PilM n=1 Tax=Alkalicoccus daliensis TaxID=745820 RepID=A0A1H0CM45_9BACI|nr:pilus assembly protein PilM [Alkalicoccus daliensis]SDN58977.1 type IV pilus assembly protein PilM [Alkalicoccus daliensis]
MAIQLGNKTQHALLLSDHVIRYARVKGRKLDGVEIIEERYLPQGVFAQGEVKEVETLLTILSECVEKWKLRNQKVVFSIPDSLSLVRRHEVPLNIAEASITGHLYMELGESLHLPLEQPVFDWHEIGRTAEYRDLLIFAAPEPAVTTLARLMREVRLKPVAADISPLSLYRLYDKMYNTEEKIHTMFLQMAPSYMQVSIFEEELPLVIRTMNFQLDASQWQVTEDASEPLVWQGAEEDIRSSWQDTLEELSKLLNFYQYNYQQGKARVDKIVVTGDHPYAGHFVKDVKQRLELPVSTFAESDWVTKDNEEIPSKYYAVIGLALKKEV